MMQILNCEQGSPEWHSARLGIPTASEMHNIMSGYGEVYQRDTATAKKGDKKAQPARATYMDKLIGERIRGVSSEKWQGNWATEKGHADEPLAIAQYAELANAEVSKVGIILNHGVGYSPDGLLMTVDGDGLAEVKSKEPHLYLPIYFSAGIPAEHVDQCQTGLWVAEKEWIDFIVYCSGMKLIVRRAYRDEPYIKKMAQAVKEFNEDLEARLEAYLKESGE